MATMHAANHFPVQAIITLTESGATARWISRLYATVPIYAVSANPQTVNQLSLVSNVFPILIDYHAIASDEINHHIVENLRKNGLIESQAWVLLTRGRQIGKPGGTDCMEIIRV